MKTTEIELDGSKTSETNPLIQAILEIGVENIVQYPLEAAAYIKLVTMGIFKKLSFNEMLQELNPLDYSRARIERKNELAGMEAGNLKWEYMQKPLKYRTEKYHLST